MKCVGLMILFLHWSLSDAQRFELKGPAGPVVAAPGSDIILSCSLNTRESAVNMEVTWSRSDLNDRVVHHYKDQQDSEQHHLYRHRTSLFKDELKDGNTSLLLRNVQMSDEGKYKCEVQDGGVYDILMVKVIVTGPASIIDAAPGSDIILSCSLNTRESAVNMEVMWSRSDLNDRVVHHYKDQQDSEQDPSYRNRTSLFKEKLKNGNTSLLLKDVQRSDEGTYRCEVQGKGTYEENIVTVTVTDPGKYPVITVQGRDHSGGIQLLCETKGWSVEHELQWVDSGGRELPAGAPRRDPEGFNLRLPLTVFGNDTYITCQVKDHPSMKAQMDISVIGSKPVITKLGSVGSGGTRLQCETNSWKSKPDLEWFSDKGTRLIEEEQNYTVVNGSYTVRHSITAHGSGNSIIICEVKQFPSMEDRFFIPDSSLLNDGYNPSNSWKIATIIFIVFFTIVGL